MTRPSSPIACARCVPACLTTSPPLRRCAPARWCVAPTYGSSTPTLLFTRLLLLLLLRCLLLRGSVQVFRNALLANEAGSLLAEAAEALLVIFDRQWMQLTALWADKDKGLQPEAQDMEDAASDGDVKMDEDALQTQAGRGAAGSTAAAAEEAAGTAAGTAAATAAAAAAAVDEEPQDVLDEEWLFDGHAWLGRGVRRLLQAAPIANRFRDFTTLAPQHAVMTDGVVEKWVPQGKQADDWALWRARYTDGSVEDLEEHEAAEAIAMWTARHGANGVPPPQRAPVAAEPAPAPEVNAGAETGGGSGGGSSGGAQAEASASLVPADWRAAGGHAVRREEAAEPTAPAVELQCSLCPYKTTLQNAMRIHVSRWCPALRKEKGGTAPARHGAAVAAVAPAARGSARARGDDDDEAYIPGDDN